MYPQHPYALDHAGQSYEVLAPDSSDYHRVRLPDGQVTGVPGDSAGELTAEALAAWIANPPAPLLTLAQAEALLDTILDEWAAAKGYANAARAITYAADPDATFAAEGQAMLNARSAVWVGARSMVTAPDFTGELTESGVRAFAAQFAPVWITA